MRSQIHEEHFNLHDVLFEKKLPLKVLQEVIMSKIISKGHIMIMKKKNLTLALYVI